MGVLSFVKDIFKPAADLVDNVHTSTEEKLELRNKLAEIEKEVSLKALELENNLIQAQSNIIVAEANSDSWLTKSFRPGIMVAITALLFSYWFGFSPESLPVERLFDLLEIGIGGYIGARTIDKGIKAFKG